MDIERNDAITGKPRPENRTTVRRVLRWSLFIAAVLLLPLVPLAVLGLSFEERVETLLNHQMTGTQRFWLITGLLSADLILPVPSSAVSTYGGGRIGFWPAFFASSLGMTISAAIGYAISFWLGEPIARRLSREDDFLQVRRLSDRIGPFALLLTRPLPIIAEASVLLAGTTRMPPHRVFPAVLIGNAAVSFVYSLFGALFHSDGALPVAIGLSAVLPLLLSHWLRKRHADL